VLYDAAAIMPAPLNFDDFKVYNLTCEVRYENAYLIYDRTGHIVESLKGTFTNIQVASATPAQSSFTSSEGTCVVELGASRFTSPKPGRGAELFASHCKAFFGAVTSQLNVSIFTRIGFRYIGRREFKLLEDAKAAVAGLGLTTLKPTKRFNSSDGPTEIVFRWEDSEIGAFFRVRAEPYTFKLTAPLEYAEVFPETEKKILGVTLDIDYYTVAPVDRDQWEPEEWLLQRYRIMRKETDGILQGGSK
jgi:uncharacterized protein (TIGR04255 family)